MKKILSLALALILTAALLAACGGVEEAQNENQEEQTVLIPTEKIEGSSLYVRKVENLPEDFIFGMDVSSLIAEEQSGVRYYDFDGQEKDLLQILAENGVTHIRVRIWNDPYDEQGRGFGGGNCDIDKAVEIGVRAARCGMKLIVDFHYSDFWADPNKQQAPRAWEGMDPQAKSDAAYAYTRDCLQKLRDAGVDVAMVQVGNEINNGLCGEFRWVDFHGILSAGSRAAREIFPEALVAVHFADPENAESFSKYAERLASYGVDYDVFASSYYPYWHGTLENLYEVLTGIAQSYGKKVMVMETSYAYTGEDTDFFGNAIGDGSSVPKNYPYTVQGQANAVRDVIDTVAQAGGIGVCYWEGAWISVGTGSWEENHARWEQFGSGWASSYAAVYDPDDAGQWYGGSSWDNQAFFDAAGHPLESLRVFNLVRWGNETELKADGLEDSFLTVDLAGTIVLPDTVNAIFSDNSRRPVPVSWDLDQATLEQMLAGGPETYLVTGVAEGLEARCYVSMVKLNYLANGDFETGSLEPWTLQEFGRADELYVENKLSDSLDGQWHMHYWSSAKDSVDFCLEQTLEELPEGSYQYAISIMGGDCGETEIYAYVKIDGELTETAPLKIQGYNNWDTARIGGIRITAGQKLTVGIAVKCQGSGNGAWGKIDGAMLNSEG